eukprot:EG_transcript_27254
MFAVCRPAVFALRMGRVGALRLAHTQAPQGQQSLKDTILGIELAGEEFYRKLAVEAPEPLDEVFSRLADEERHHHHTLEQAFANGTLTAHDLHSSDIVDVAESTLKTIERDHSVSKQMKSMAEVYKMARDMEAANRDKYLDLLEKETNPKAKKIWEYLAAEEQKHFHAMDVMVRFMDKAHIHYYV